MGWVKLDDRFWTHPKAVRAGRDGRDLFLVGLAYSSGGLTDGFIDAEALPMLAVQSGVVKVHAACKRLVEVGLWETAEGGYRVHDYLDYQPSGDEVRQQRAEAQKRRQAEVERVTRWRAERNKPVTHTPSERPNPNGVTGHVTALVTGSVTEVVTDDATGPVTPDATVVVTPVVTPHARPRARVNPVPGPLTSPVNSPGITAPENLQSGVSQSFSADAGKKPGEPREKARSPGTGPPRVVGNPRLQAIVDLVTVEGVPIRPTGRDGVAVRECAAEPSEIAAAYIAAYRGEWNPGGNDWLRESLAIHAVIGKLAGYLAWREQPSPRRRATGRAAPPGRAPVSEETLEFARQIEAEEAAWQAAHGEHHDADDA